MFQYMSNFKNKYCFSLCLNTRKKYGNLLKMTNTDVNGKLLKVVLVERRDKKLTFINFETVLESYLVSKILERCISGLGFKRQAIPCRKHQFAASIVALQNMILMSATKYLYKNIKLP